MPAKNSIKTYLENGYYHLYNRGVEKRLIFLDQQDYGVFLSYLKEYLLPKPEKELREKLADPQISAIEKNKTIIRLKLKNFAGEINLFAYCLMPNHFHFFVKQKSANAIDLFMQSICTRYTMYFNRKYKRVGHLYQGVYKAVMITTEEQFIYLSKYIHRQALRLKGETSSSLSDLGVEDLQPRQPSSYSQYLGSVNAEWVKQEEILSYFSKTNPTLSYKTFVTENDDYGSLKTILKSLED